jgi:hypothetical protein
VEAAAIPDDQAVPLLPETPARVPGGGFGKRDYRTLSLRK